MVVKTEELQVGWRLIMRVLVKNKNVNLLHPKVVYL